LRKRGGIKKGNRKIGPSGGEKIHLTDQSVRRGGIYLAGKEGVTTDQKKRLGGG